MKIVLAGAGDHPIPTQLRSGVGQAIPLAPPFSRH